MMVVHPSVPANTLAEFVAYAKKQPLVYAHAGPGSGGHLAMEYFRTMAGFETVQVPYRGNAPLVVDLLAGQVKAGFVATAGVIQHVRDGKLKGLAISATARSPLAPDVPTTAEAGYPDFKLGSYFVLLGPAGLPDAIAESAGARSAGGAQIAGAARQVRRARHRRRSDRAPPRRGSSCAPIPRYGRGSRRMPTCGWTEHGSIHIAVIGTQCRDQHTLL